MKHIKTLTAILTACLLLTVVSCSPSDAPADTQTSPESVSGTVPETEPVTEIEPTTETESVCESETSSSVVYNAYSYAEYQDMCIALPVEDTMPSGSARGFYLRLTSRVLKVKTNTSFTIPTEIILNVEDADEDIVYAYGPTNYTITCHIEESNLMEVTGINSKKVLLHDAEEAAHWGNDPDLKNDIPGLGMHSLNPGVAHLFITVTHIPTGKFFTLQQIVVIEES